MEEVEVKELEEEDPNIHFKRKRKGGSRRKRVVKKPCRHAPVIAKSESAAVAPPPAPLVIKLSAQKQATDKAIPGLGKTSSLLQHTHAHARAHTHTHMYVFFLFPLLSCSGLI